MHDPTHEPESHAKLAALGTEMNRILKSEAFETGVLLARARIFEEWCSASSQTELDRLKSEQRALERLLQSLETILTNGMIAQESIRRANAELDEDIEDA